MTKQEEIREEILRIENCETAIECPLEPDDPCAECRTNQILSYLHSQGVVIKVEGELPEEPTWCSLDGKAIRGARSVYKIAQQDILNAGYAPVEPLIEGD